LSALSAKGDPLEAIDRLVPWENFRGDTEAVVLSAEGTSKSSAGRKPLDAIVMFRMLVFQALNNLSHEQVECQVRDRPSFTRFCGWASTTAFRMRRRCGCSGEAPKAAMLGCPHGALRRESSAQQEITSDSSDSRTSRIGS
jgi:Transposase domain (DUF772)